MTIQVEVARDWLHLLDLLYAGSWNGDLRRHRSPYVFHGSHDASFPLQTSLQRLGGDLRASERHLLRNFRKYARHDAGGDSLWHWLALGQHHGLPTRLLDFTYSPLVALHFATREPHHFTHDGAIWMVDHVSSNAHLPGVLHTLLTDEGSQVFTTDLLGRAVPAPTVHGVFDGAELGHLESLSPSAFLMFLEPPSLDERIVQQYALFALLSSPEPSPGDWLADRPSTCIKLIIPAALKWQIRDHLDQSNVNERTLFPGLGGLARWLQVYYSTPPAEAESQDPGHRP